MKALMIVAVAVMLTACGGSKEIYKGPVVGKTCEQAYENPANVKRCSYGEFGQGGGK